MTTLLAYFTMCSNACRRVVAALTCFQPNFLGLVSAGAILEVFDILASACFNNLTIATIPGPAARRHSMVSFRGQ